MTKTNRFENDKYKENKLTTTKYEQYMRTA